MTSSLIAHPDKDKVCNLNVDPEASKILFATACQATKRLFGDLFRFKTSVYFCYKGRSTLVPIVPQCLKITENVPFNNASEASYLYILSGQKLIKNAKNGAFWRVFENLKLAVKQSYQTGQFK